MCVILPQVTGMVQGRTLRHELLESKAGFSNTLNSPQKLQSIIALWIIEKKNKPKKLIPLVRNLLTAFTAQLKLGKNSKGYSNNIW